MFEITVIRNSEPPPYDTDRVYSCTAYRKRFNSLADFAAFVDNLPPDETFTTMSLRDDLGDEVPARLSVAKGLEIL